MLSGKGIDTKKLCTDNGVPPAQADACKAEIEKSYKKDIEVECDAAYSGGADPVKDAKLAARCKNIYGALPAPDTDAGYKAIQKINKNFGGTLINRLGLTGIAGIKNIDAYWKAKVVAYASSAPSTAAATAVAGGATAAPAAAAAGEAAASTTGADGTGGMSAYDAVATAVKDKDDAEKTLAELRGICSAAGAKQGDCAKTLESVLQEVVNKSGGDAAKVIKALSDPADKTLGARYVIEKADGSEVAFKNIAGVQKVLGEEFGADLRPENLGDGAKSGSKTPEEKVAGFRLHAGWSFGVHAGVGGPADAVDPVLKNQKNTMDDVISARNLHLAVGYMDGIAGSDYLESGLDFHLFDPEAKGDSAVEGTNVDNFHALGAYGRYGKRISDQLGIYGQGAVHYFWSGGILDPGPIYSGLDFGMKRVVLLGLTPTIGAEYFLSDSFAAHLQMSLMWTFPNKEKTLFGQTDPTGQEAQEASYGLRTNGGFPAAVVFTTGISWGSTEKAEEEPKE